MKDYNVVWEIELNAKNSKDAARQALAIQRDPGSIATVFDVYPPGKRRLKPVRVDLGYVQRNPASHARAYVALSVYQGIIDEVKVFRSRHVADHFIRAFEREQGIKGARERKHQREYKDTYATWYECELEK